MDIRPFDAQMFIVKSADNNKTNNDILKYSEIYQNLSDNFKKNDENQNRKTAKLNKSEKQNIDQNSKGNSEYFKEKNNKNKSKKQKKDKNKKESNGIIDVSI